MVYSVQAMLCDLVLSNVVQYTFVCGSAMEHKKQPIL